jgi:hypothetical protein
VIQEIVDRARRAQGLPSVDVSDKEPPGARAADAVPIR